MLRKSQILSTLHQFPSKMYITYLPSHIHTIFNRFSPPTCLLDFTFCPSNIFIPSNMFIEFCLFALPTLLFHPTRLLGTLEYMKIFLHPQLFSGIKILRKIQVVCIMRHGSCESSRTLNVSGQCFIVDVLAKRCPPHVLYLAENHT